MSEGLLTHLSSSHRRLHLMPGSSISTALRSEAIEQQARIFDITLSAITDFACIFDRDIRFVYVNKALLDLWGLELEQAVGKNFFDLQYPAELAAKLQRQIQQVFDTGQGLTDETPYTSPTGAGGYYEYIFSPVTGADGAVEVVAGSTRDITVRRRAELERDRALAAAQDERARLHALFMAAPAIICVLRGPEHICELANPLYLEVIGRSGPEILGKPIREALPELEGQPYFEILDRVYRTGEPFVGKERRVLLNRRGTGVLEEVFLDFVYQPTRNASGSVDSILVHAVDITGQVRARQTVETLAEKLGRDRDLLRRANADLEQFAYTASHDLQEPIRNISIYGELLSRRYAQALDAAGKECLAFVTAGARHMQMLVKDLLAYAQSAKIEDEPPGEADSAVALDKALASLSAAIGESQAEISHAELPTLRVREMHLEQLFQNLIGNAIKYRREDEPPRIRVTAERNGGDWLFSVRDNGIGIAPEHKGLVFGLFKRLHNKTQYSGTGIGLAICQRIVERNGGRIWIESEGPGKGSTFHFTLPA